MDLESYQRESCRSTTRYSSISRCRSTRDYHTTTKRKGKLPVERHSRWMLYISTYEQSTNLNAHKVGTYNVAVKVTGENDVLLGKDSGTFTATISQHDLDVAKQKAKDQQKSKDLLQEGRQLWKEGKLDQAIAKVAQAQQLIPKDQEVAKTLKAMQQQKKTVDTKLSEASDLIKRDKLDDASKALTRAATINDKYPKYLELLKQLTDAKKKAQEQKNLLAKLLKDAKTLQSTGKLNEAVTILQNGTKKLPKNEEIKKLLQEIQKQQNDALKKMTDGQTQWKNGLLESAITILQEASKTDPSNKKIAKVLENMQSQKKILDDTLSKVEQSIEQKEFMQAKSLLGKAGHISKNYPPYVAMVKKLASAEHDAIIVAEAEKKRQEEEKVKKEKEFEKRRRAEQIKKLLNDAKSKWQQKDKNGAIAQLDEILQIDPNNQEAITQKQEWQEITEDKPPQITAEQKGGYWKLVNIKGNIGRECTPKEVYNDYYRSTISGKEGDITLSAMIRERNHTYFSARGTWQRPPQVMYPDSVIEIPLSIQKIVEDTSEFYGEMYIYLDDQDMNCGSSGGGKINIGSIKVDHKSPSTVEKISHWKVETPFRGEAGEKFTIRVCYNGNICGNKGWRYHYEWVSENSKDRTPLTESDAEKIDGITDISEEKNIIVSSDQNIYPDPSITDDLADSNHYVIDGDESHAWVKLLFKDSALNTTQGKSFILKLTISTVEDAASRHGLVIYYKDVIVGKVGAVTFGEIVEIPLDMSKIGTLNGQFELILKATGTDAPYIESKYSGKGAELKIISDLYER